MIFYDANDDDDDSAHDMKLFGFSSWDGYG